MEPDKADLHEAVLWESRDNGKTACKLCAHRCVIEKGNFGRCAMRQNIEGTLYSHTYKDVCAANADPIEKKPLFHFLPGTRSFSIAAEGCNFQCVFCQNWQISQAADGRHRKIGRAIRPIDIVDSALHANCDSIAYTYTEPTIFMELAADCGKLARQKELANVFVSNGFMTPEAIQFAKPWLDGINIDLKSFSEDFYKKLCGARLAPVLETIEYIAKKTDIWMELTTLIIPGENDSDEELRSIAEFIVNQAGRDVPWHVSRFYPQYKMGEKKPTAQEVLNRAYDIGKEAGLNYIYIGNLPGTGAESTFCPSCGKLLIERTGYTILSNSIVDGRCPQCNAEIAGFGL